MFDGWCCLHCLVLTIFYFGSVYRSRIACCCGHGWNKRSRGTASVVIAGLSPTRRGDRDWLSGAIYLGNFQLIFSKQTC